MCAVSKEVVALWYDTTTAKLMVGSSCKRTLQQCNITSVPWNKCCCLFTAVKKHRGLTSCCVSVHFINIKVVSTSSSNEFSLIWSHNIHYPRAYHWPTWWPVSSWPDSITGRALQWHLGGQDSNPIQAFLLPLLK